MKTLNTYTPNDLKTLAHLNFHTMKRILEAKGIHPLVERKMGVKTFAYYGEDALEVAQAIADEKKMKLTAKQEKAAIRAARLAAGLGVGRGHPLVHPKDLQQPAQKPLDVPQSNPEPVINKAIAQLTRIADAMERLASAWEARPNCKE
jgi:hypothetical protein